MHASLMQFHIRTKILLTVFIIIPAKVSYCNGYDNTIAIIIIDIYTLPH